MPAKVTDVAPEKPVPVMVTMRPPSTEPWLGLMAVIAGGGSGGVATMPSEKNEMDADVATKREPDWSEEVETRTGEELLVVVLLPN